LLYGYETEVTDLLFNI